MLIPAPLIALAAGLFGFLYLGFDVFTGNHLLWEPLTLYSILIAIIAITLELIGRR